MAKGSGSTRASSSSSPRGLTNMNYPIPQTFKMVKEDDGFGNKQVARYISKEDPTVEIVIERGAMNHNNPTGFTLTKDGNTEFARGDIVSYLTLKEAKEAAKYYAKRGWQ